MATKTPAKYLDIGILVLRQLADDLTFFTADEWWPRFEAACAQYGVDTSQRDASGAVFTRAYREGIVRKVPGRYRRSTRPAAHAKMLPLLTRGTAPVA